MYTYVSSLNQYISISPLNPATPGFLDQVWATGFNDLYDVSDTVYQRALQVEGEQTLVQMLFSLQSVSLDEDEKAGSKP